MKMKYRNSLINQRQRKVHSLTCFWWDVVSGHWSNGNCTQILRRVSQVKELSVYSQEALPLRIHPILGRIVASSFICTSPLAFTTIVGLVDILTVSNSALLRSFLLTTGIQFYGGCGQQNPLFGRRIECGFVLFLWACKYFWQDSRRLRGRIALFLQSLLEICPQIQIAQGLRWWGIFSERRTFIFSDVCLTQCSLRESYSSIWFQHVCALPRNQCRFWRLRVLWYATQLSHTFHNSNCTFAFILLRFFVWSFFDLPVRKWALFAELTSRFGL